MEEEKWEKIIKKPTYFDYGEKMVKNGNKIQFINMPMLSRHDDMIDAFRYSMMCRPLKLKWYQKLWKAIKRILTNSN